MVATSSHRAVGAGIGVSQGSVRNALVLADDGTRTEEACPATTSDTPPEPEPEPGAGLVIDQGNPLGAMLADDLPVMTLERTFPDPATGDTVMQQSLKTFDRPTQIETITWVYDRMDAEGRIYRQISRMELRHTLAPEMRLLLALSGFHDVEFYGGYDFTPYEEDSPRLFVVAARGEAGL